MEFLGLRSFGERILADLCRAWWIVLLLLVLVSSKSVSPNFFKEKNSLLFQATVVALFWIYLMRYFAKIMVW